MRISRNLRNRRLFKEAFKAGYKKALRESRVLLKEGDEVDNPEWYEAVDTVEAAVQEAAEEGVTDVAGIIDYWQQLYADEVLYGDNPLEIDDLADAVCHGLELAGIKADWGEVADALQDYANMREDFRSQFTTRSRVRR